jgi:hypothetical protein
LGSEVWLLLLLLREVPWVFTSVSQLSSAVVVLWRGGRAAAEATSQHGMVSRRAENMGQST